MKDKLLTPKELNKCFVPNKYNKIYNRDLKISHCHDKN